VYVVRLADRFSRTDRDRILFGLRENGIGCSNYFAPIHLQPFYVKDFGFQPGEFPITEGISERTIALPFFSAITVQGVERVTACLAEQIRL